MRLVINKRHVRAQQITALLMHIIRSHVPKIDRDAERDLCREIEDQMWADGAQMITEGDRIAAGLPPRNINGLTVDELCIIEARLMMAMRQPIVANRGMLDELDIEAFKAPGHITWMPDGPLMPWKLQVEEGFKEIMEADIISVDLYDHRRRLEVRYVSGGMKQTAIVAIIIPQMIDTTELNEMRRYGNDAARIAKSRHLP